MVEAKRVRSVVTFQILPWVRGEKALTEEIVGLYRAFHREDAVAPGCCTIGSFWRRRLSG